MTLAHIVSTTNVRHFLRKHVLRRSDDDLDPDKILEKHGVDMIKEFQRNFNVSCSTNCSVVF